MFLGNCFSSLSFDITGELISCKKRGCSGNQLAELLQHGQRDLLELELGAAADLSICEAHCGRRWRQSGGGKEG